MKRYLILLLPTLTLISCEAFPLEPSQDEIHAWIQVDPIVDDCPLLIEGEARGSWFFEAQFQVELLDSSGTSLGNTIAFTSEDWMTENFISFKATLDYESSDPEGILVFHKANPSGLPENDMTLKKNVSLEPCMVKKYIETHLEEISPIEPVLGGQWYLLSLEFLGEDYVRVLIEDGHIQEEFTARYEISEEESVNLYIIN